MEYDYLNVLALGKLGGDAFWRRCGLVDSVSLCSRALRCSSAQALHSVEDELLTISIYRLRPAYVARTKCEPKEVNCTH